MTSGHHRGALGPTRVSPGSAGDLTSHPALTQSKTLLNLHLLTWEWGGESTCNPGLA